MRAEVGGGTGGGVGVVDGGVGGEKIRSTFSLCVIAVCYNQINV